MMAAAQPFLSGAISKTVNMPEEATIEDVEHTAHRGLADGHQGCCHSTGTTAKLPSLWRRPSGRWQDRLALRPTTAELAVRSPTWKGAGDADGGDEQAGAGAYASQAQVADLFFPGGGLRGLRDRGELETPAGRSLMKSQPGLDLPHRCTPPGRTRSATCACEAYAPAPACSSPRLHLQRLFQVGDLDGQLGVVGLRARRSAIARLVVARGWATLQLSR